MRSSSKSPHPTASTVFPTAQPELGVTRLARPPDLLNGHQATLDDDGVFRPSSPTTTRASRTGSTRPATPRPHRRTVATRHIQPLRHATNSPIRGPSEHLPPHTRRSPSRNGRTAPTTDARRRTPSPSLSRRWSHPPLKAVPAGHRLGRRLLAHPRAPSNVRTPGRTRRRPRLPRPHDSL